MNSSRADVITTDRELLQKALASDMLNASARAVFSRLLHTKIRSPLSIRQRRWVRGILDGGEVLPERLENVHLVIDGKRMCRARIAQNITDDASKITCPRCRRFGPMVNDRDLVDRDAELLEAALDQDLTPDAREAFERMRVELARRGPLTPKQRAWASAASRGEHYEPELEYENLVSSGHVPRGREVALMVRDKPLRPPGRG